MSVNKTTISGSIQSLTAEIESLSFDVDDSGVPDASQVADAKKKWADGMADIIRDAILSADVTVIAGITVSTAGTAVAQTGATTSTGTTTIQ